MLCDGKNVLPLATSQDHKRLQDGDAGPNTGGMGAYSPAPVVTPGVHARAMREVILPTIRGMEKDGIPFSGFLYAGLMIDAQGHVKTLEFNCRMGDPETQPIMARLKTDWVDVLWAATEPVGSNALADLELQWDRRTALGVVLAAPGYPQSPRQGDAITGIPKESDEVVVFHAGTQFQDSVNSTTIYPIVGPSALASGCRTSQRNPTPGSFFLPGAMCSCPARKRKGYWRATSRTSSASARYCSDSNGSPSSPSISTPMESSLQLSRPR